MAYLMVMLGVCVAAFDWLLAHAWLAAIVLLAVVVALAVLLPTAQGRLIFTLANFGAGVAAGALVVGRKVV